MNRKYYSSNAIYEGAASLYWQDRAECKGTDISWFFSNSKANNENKLPGRHICADCSVKIECLEYALKNQEPYGIWGGLTTKERRKLVRIHDDKCA